MVVFWNGDDLVFTRRSRMDRDRLSAIMDFDVVLAITNLSLAN